MNTIFDNSGKCEQGDGHYALLGDCQRSEYHKRSLHRRHHHHHCHHHRHNDYCHHWQICFVSQWATDSLQMWIHPFLWLHPPGYDQHDDVFKCCCQKQKSNFMSETRLSTEAKAWRPSWPKAGLGLAMVVKMIIWWCWMTLDSMTIFCCFSRAHSRRTPGVLGSPMNCNNLCLKGVLQICIKHV